VTGFRFLLNNSCISAKTVAIFLLALLGKAAIAQNTRITGRVNDENAKPLAGVSVTEQGTQNGTLSDEHGKYTLDVQHGKLIFSYAISIRPYRSMGKITSMYHYS